MSFVLGAAFDRPLRFLAKQELWSNRLVGRLMDVLGGIPVARARGDVGAVAAVARALDKGDVVAIFPQGTTLGPTDRPWQRGAARLALTTGAPLVPVAIVGAAAGLRPGTWLPRLTRVRVVIGEPIRRRANDADDPRHARADRASAGDGRSRWLEHRRFPAPAGKRQAHSIRARTPLRLVRLPGPARASRRPGGAEGEHAPDHPAVPALRRAPRPRLGADRGLRRARRRPAVPPSRGARHRDPGRHVERRGHRRPGAAVLRSSPGWSRSRS